MTNFNLCLLLVSRDLRLRLQVLLVYSKSNCIRVGKIRGKWSPHLVLVIGNYVAPGTSLHFDLGTRIEIYYFLLSYIRSSSAPTEVAEAKCLLHSRRDHHYCWAPAVRDKHTQTLMEMGEQIKLTNLTQNGKRRIMDSIVITAVCCIDSSFWSQWSLDFSRSHHLRKWKEKGKRWLMMIVNWIYGHS